MHASSLFAVLAAGVAVVAADYAEGSSTVTSTSTMTATVTIKKCKEGNTECPAYSTSAVPSSSTYYPMSNTTSTYAVHTEHPGTGATYLPSATGGIYTSTSMVGVQPTHAASSTPSTVPTSGAENVFVQSGLLLGVLGVGIAILA